MKWYYLIIIGMIVMMLAGCEVGCERESEVVRKEMEKAKDVSIDYKDDNITIEFKKDGIIMGQMTLKSHKTYDEIRKVTTGKNKTVVWYEFSDFKDIKRDALKEVEFIDMRKMIENKTYTEMFKGDIELMDESKILIPNPNYLLPIEKDYSFVYLDEKGNWIPYNSFDIPKKNIIIGVQTNLGWGEFLDVRFNVFGNKLDRHAVVLGTNAGFVTEAPTEDPGGLSEANINEIAYAVKDVAPVGAVKIIEIGWYCSLSAGVADTTVGIYTHNISDDEPEELLGSATLSTGGAEGWKVATGLDIPITPGNTYWIAAQCDDATPENTVDFSMATARIAYKSGQTDLTNPWGTTDSFYTNIIVAIYAVVEIAVDTCTYPGSGDWNVECSDNCTISSPVTGDGSNLNIGGSPGTFNVGAEIDNFNVIHISDDCVVTCQGAGNCLIGR